MIQFLRAKLKNFNGIKASVKYYRGIVTSGFSVAIALVSLAKLDGSSIVHAATLEAIQERGHLIAAIKGDVRPLSFRDETGEQVGLEIDLVRALAESIVGNREAVVFRIVSNRERLPVVISGEVDLAIAQVTASNTRQRVVSFSEPYYLDGTALVTRHSGVKTLMDLRGQAIAVVKGSSAIPHVRALIPGVTLVGADSYQDALTFLDTRPEVVAFAGDASVLSGWVQEHKHYRLLPTLIGAYPLSVVTPKGLAYDSLRRAVDRAIVQRKETGWLEQQIQRWGLPTTPNLSGWSSNQ